ncbi:AMIN-like domain-containing (lipo)protein [Garicola koreensis]|uniref:AMIN-like domain-containing protein n=1 Tax=Garicola koreensis TaxID=1262554 RepID=A0A7W5U2Z2_9MICC|nr:hypothetical protein [Garicola koreensis]MBB3668191.1 hypothetical protein [Garicola koreensis]
MDIRPARDAARRHHLPGGRRRVVSRTAAAAALLLVAVTGCTDDSQPTPEETPAPPLDQPTEETAESQNAESESQPAQDETTQNQPDDQAAETAETGETAETDDTTEAPEPNGGSQGGGSQDEDSEVLDASEFSSESQQSPGFPDMLTEFPEDGDELLLTEVRAGQHEGYDRIVFEHAGDGAPGWYAEYVDEAVEPGSGFPLELDGEAILYVSAVGLVPGNAGSEQGQLELSTLSEPKGTVFQDVATTFVHHGTASYYVGLDEERDFRVSVWEHEDGPRLIIDVLH